MYMQIFIYFGFSFVVEEPYLQKCVRGGPHLSSFSLMIIPIVRGGRGLKNDDEYHKF